MKKLIVMECDHVYNAWRIEKKTGNVFSEIKLHKYRKATDDFWQYGVYRKSGLPYEIKKITRDMYPEMEPYQAIAKMYSDEVCLAISKGNPILASSGYCAYAPAIVGGIQRAIGEDKKIGVVWMDAHADNVIVESVSEENVRFVAFPLSTILGQTMHTWRKEICGLTRALSGEEVLVGDARLTDQTGLQSLEEVNANLISFYEFERKEIWDKKIQLFAKQVDVIYIMIDADILAEQYIPAYFESEPEGHDLDIVLHNVKSVMETEKVVAISTFCFDFDKYEQGGEITSLSAMKIIGTALENW